VIFECPFTNASFEKLSDAEISYITDLIDTVNCSPSEEICHPGVVTRVMTTTPAAKWLIERTIQMYCDKAGISASVCFYRPYLYPNSMSKAIFDAVGSTLQGDRVGNAWEGIARNEATVRQIDALTTFYAEAQKNALLWGFGFFKTVAGDSQVDPRLTISPMTITNYRDLDRGHCLAAIRASIEDGRIEFSDFGAKEGGTFKRHVDVAVSPTKISVSSRCPIEDDIRMIKAIMESKPHLMDTCHAKIEARAKGRVLIVVDETYLKAEWQDLGPTLKSHLKWEKKRRLRPEGDDDLAVIEETGLETALCVSIRTGYPVPRDSRTVVLPSFGFFR
jgi:hypothetical protein